MLLLSLTTGLPARAEINLPTIGDASSSVVSVQREQEIGSIFIKMLHSQVKTTSDPELIEYVENLVYRLAEASELKNRKLSIILIDSPALNAFAAPGGVVGINTGLFLYARTEEEFSGVIAHELAHLSQRHYARGVEAAKRQRLPTMAALLGSIVLAASGAGDLGAAALSSTIAGAQSSKLAFTRDNEREADRVGILTMARADMDPRAMASLFERMSKLESGGPQYEFLRTHPLSRNRVADTRSRAEQYPPRPSRNLTTYEIMRNRAILDLSDSPEKARTRFRDVLNSGRTSSPNATRYILAQAELDLQNPKAAIVYSAPLVRKEPNNLHYQILNNKVRFAVGETSEAISTMRQLLKDNPGNYPITMGLAELLYNDGQYRVAMNLLKSESQRRPDDPNIWYSLAETAGLAKDIYTVHTARAEYFFLVGDMDDSIKHLEYAMELPGTSFTQKTALKERVKIVKDYKKNMRL